jgi:hypothetical protein
MQKALAGKVTQRPWAKCEEQSGKGNLGGEAFTFLA